MRTAITLADFVWRDTLDFADTAQYVVSAKRLGVNTLWSAGAWRTDGVVPLAFVAALTSRIRLATGILQINARAAPMTAMTAMTLDHVSSVLLDERGPRMDVEALHHRQRPSTEHQPRD